MDSKPTENFRKWLGSVQDHKTTALCAAELPDVPIRDIDFSWFRYFAFSVFKNCHTKMDENEGNIEYLLF